MAGIDGEELRRSGLAIGVDNFDFRVEFEVFDNGTGTMRVGSYEKRRPCCNDIMSIS